MPIDPKSIRLRTLLSAEQISAGVSELATRIAATYQGDEIALVPILSGSLVFTSDLVRRLPMDMVIHVCGLSSYRDSATGPGTLNWTMPLPNSLGGRHVLVIDDILDTGSTLRRVCDEIAAQKPASVRTCVLLVRESSAMKTDFCGFRIGPGFVVGYGLDFAGRFRNLPYIAVVEQ
ncbi:MAG: phosphoribosyltransferase family protein [Phycisphaerae bacterium]|nr:phosphoribosyltransferase family protein [Phycisphaerae bacterium]